LSDNIDNLLSDIYSSDSQSQGVKELANLINNLSQLLLKAISQLESRVLKIEQQLGRGGVGAQPQRTTSPIMTPAPAPKPKVASPFGAPVAPQRTPPPPPRPATTASPVTAPSPAAPKKSEGPASVAEAASMLGVTLKKAPSAGGGGSGPSFLTATVSPGAPSNATPTPASSSPTPQPASGEPAAPADGGMAGPRGGFRGELAEKLAKRRKKVQEQLESDFEGGDLAAKPSEPEVVEESTSSELKVDLEEELRNAFSKLKG